MMKTLGDDAKGRIGKKGKRNAITKNVVENHQSTENLKKGKDLETHENIAIVMKVMIPHIPDGVALMTHQVMMVQEREQKNHLEITGQKRKFEE